MGRLGGRGTYLRRRSGGNTGGVVPLPATGTPRTDARQCRKERDKAADAQAAVSYVLLPRQQRMGLPG